MLKPLAIALSGAGRELCGGESRGNLTNVQCKSIWNWHNESPLRNEYMLIKMKKKSLALKGILARENTRKEDTEIIFKMYSSYGCMIGTIS
jgi:hypothetical protein